MLKTNNNFKKYRIPLITMAIVVSGIFLFQYLTFTHEYSSAEEISTDTPVTITPTTPLAKWDDLEYMQQMTPQACASAVVGDSKSLIDNSAGVDSKKTYTVQKMQISNECWMTENMDNETGRLYHDTTYGGYYNWDNARIICSKMGNGWVLSAQTQYQSVISTYNNKNSLMNSPYKFLDGGYYSGGLKLNGSDGRYWTSVPVDDSAYFLNFTKYGVSVYNSNSKSNGFSVRCVAKTTSTETPVDPSEPTGSGIINPNVSVTVDKILTMELSSSEVNIEPKTNEVMTGNFTATVSSNAGYDIELSAAEDSSTALVNKKDNVTVAEIPASNNIQVGNNGWGIKCIGDEDCVIKSYDMLTLYNNPKVYFSSTTGAAGKATNFEVGIGISPSLPSGTYSTNILVTASQK